MNTNEITLSGYGKGNAKNVHVIVNDIYTVCSINTKEKKEILPEEGLTLNSVNCAKCKRTTFYKKLLSDLNPKDNESKEQITDQEKTQDVSQTKENIVADLVQNETKQDKEQTTKTTEKGKGNEEDKPDQHQSIAKKLESYCNPIIKEVAENFQKKEAFFIGRLRTDFKYRIIHIPSEEIFFDKIPERIILQALAILNNMDSQWDGKHCIPEDHITQARYAMKAAYNSVDIKYPAALDEIAIKHRLLACRKCKVTIKRRKKVSIIIKRRVTQVQSLKRRNKSFIRRRNK